MITETKKKPSERDHENLKLINAFFSKQCYHIEKLDRDFKDQFTKKISSPAKEYFIRSMNLFQLDANNILVTVPQLELAYQSIGCAFLINTKGITKWLPVKLPQDDSYLNVYDDTSYKKPILNVRSKNSGNSHEVRDYSFNGEDFKLIRLVKEDFNDLDQNKSTKSSNPDHAIDVIKTVDFINPDVINLYNKFRLNKNSNLKKIENWQKINFIKSDIAFFYSFPNDLSKKKSYLLEGDIVFVAKKYPQWSYIKYYNIKNQRQSEGWIRAADLQSID